ncbi:MAG TPA: DNA-formamidopyrimidine glycosylase family protein [Actinomycetota bacterium]|nr:DNA-formamidopyrimidine glycosylase family protein [Actinomycetota bacterium]
MPEGDTIFRTATTLRAALAGRAVVSFRAPRLGAATIATGTTVIAVEARGKHLLIWFDDGRILHTHMQMSGSWHVYRPGERWRASRAAARVVIEVPETVAVCFRALVVEILDARAVRAHPRLSALGPDLCSPSADLDEALARLERLPPATPIAVALLDQRVACGVGNVYKSETLFACRVDPFARVEDLHAPTRRGLLVRASELLRRNLQGGPRTTYEGGLAVYGRAGRACRRCGATIRSAAQGQPPRRTYWCPACQPGHGRAQAAGEGSG